MNKKILTLVLLTTLLMTLVSAVLTFSVSTPTNELTKTTDSATFTITNNQGASLDFDLSESDFTDGSRTLALSLNETSFTLADGAEKTIKATRGSIPSEFEIGSFTSQIVVSATNGSETENQTIEVTFANDYCEVGQVGGLDISRLDFSVDGYGNDDEWYLLDEVEVEVRVDNDANEDIDDIVVEWGLYNEKTGEFIFEEEEKDFNLDEDERQTLNFAFTVDPNDFDTDDNDDDFIFFVKAYSDDLGEDTQCYSETQDITIVRDDHFVVLSDINVPETVSCNSELVVTADVWNIGDDDEEDTYVTITNAELGINKRIEIGDIDQLQDETLRTTFSIPEDVDEKSYILEFTVYDEDEDVFENDEDDEAVFRRSFVVQGNCAVDQEPVITAELVSDAIAGQELNVKVTLTNPGSKQTTYNLAVTDYDSWGTLNTVVPTTLTVPAGQSASANIFVTPNSDVSGEQMLKVKAVFGNTVTEREIFVPIQASGGIFSNLAIGDSFKENWFIWVIVLVNIILIIAIIIVVARILSR